MTRLAIWRPDSLEGQEIKLVLAERRDLWDDLRLLAPDSDSALVSDIGDEAALVQPATADNLEDIDVLFYCAESASDAAVPENLPASTLAIVVAGDGPIDGVPSIVAGINTGVLADADGPGTVASAHPAVVALATLLDPLRSLGLASCAASVVLPSSIRGQKGIDQLLDQTRAILAFQPPPPDEVFGHQLAFNLTPTSFSGQRLASALAEVLAPEAPELAVQSWLGGIFHSVTISAHVRLESGTDEAGLREIISAAPNLEFSDAPDTLGPVDAAGTAVVHLGAIEMSSPDSFWLRATMDNLTVGAAANAVGIAEVALACRAGGGNLS